MRYTSRARLRRARVINTNTFIAAVLAFLGLGGWIVQGELKYAALLEGLDADVSTFRRQQWTRPVLRGKANAGNAAEAIYAAVRDMQPLEDEVRESLATSLHTGEPLASAHAAKLQDHGPVIAKLRDATQLGTSVTRLAIEDGPAMRGPDYPLITDAVLVMLSHGQQLTAAECLLRAIDAMRLGQDLVTGATLEAASVSMRITSIAAPMTARCASRAELKDLALATRALHVLAQEPPATGTGVELHDIMGAMQLRRKEMRESSALGRLTGKANRFATWAIYGEPTRWRKIRPDQYPESIELWRAEQDRRSRTGLPGVATHAAPVMGWLYDDMRGQAMLRALTVGVATLATRARKGRLPKEPTTLHDPVLVDPFSGRPLKWRISQDADELVIWSVGENLRDDLGGSEWEPESPLDVVARFAVPAPAPAEDKKSRRRRKPR